MSLHPKSPDDYLGFLALAQIHGYPLVFAPSAEERPERTPARKRRRIRFGLAAVSRRRRAVVADCVTC